ncbi:thioredoxin [Paenibacillus thermotolerans]|uniref:thioredoxin n=1 Tax=Paenibacillus thermotolerans TaxID=3027807 RepID=UPI00236819BB|nr:MULTISPECIES: thioredoxin [unclassified Paenibacillus]
MTVIHTTDSEFNETIKEGVVLVDFWAPWCGPCRLIAPVLEELAGEAEGRFTIAKINVDDNPATAQQHGVMSIPTLKLFKDGQEVDMTVGFQDKNTLKNWVLGHI